MHENSSDKKVCVFLELVLLKFTCSDIVQNISLEVAKIPISAGVEHFQDSRSPEQA